MDNRFENFVSYASFLEAIEKLPTEEQKGKAALALLRLGHTGEWNTGGDIVVEMLLTLAAPNIAAAKNRYAKAVEGGKKGGRPRKAEPVVVEQLLAEGLTKHEIAEKLSCSVRTVERSIEELNSGATKLYDKTTDRQNLDIDIDNTTNNTTNTTNTTTTNNNIKDKDTVPFIGYEEELAENWRFFDEME